MQEFGAVPRVVKDPVSESLTGDEKAGFLRKFGAVPRVVKNPVSESLSNTKNKDKTTLFCPYFGGIGVDDTTMLRLYLVLSKVRDSNQIGITIQATANSKANTAN